VLLFLGTGTPQNEYMYLQMKFV